ncbi:MAG: 1-acyl-sn-glycerol-3-phosphate acyltransferase [Myxococcota bacterium]|jgi:1-acyl-sn-glycerol-3-phosphate acyltransferase
MAPFGYAVFFVISMMPTDRPEVRTKRLQSIMRTAFRLMHHWLRITRVIDFNPSRVDLAIPAGPFVVVTNHPSLTDVTAIMGVIPDVCTAVKAQLFDQFWLRPLLSSSGQFSAGRDAIFGGAEVRASAVELLGRGYRVLLFPEGTRSPPGALGAFGRSAFAVACEAGVPVVPVVVREAPTWLAKGDSVWLPPAELPHKRLEILAAVHPDQFDSDSRKLRDHVHSLYVDRLPLTRVATDQPI